MTIRYPHALLDDPLALAAFKEWTPEVYRDFAALQAGEMNAEQFRRRYIERHSILVLDLTGFTRSCIQDEIYGLLRIFDAQRVCIPTLQEKGASLIRAFADNLVALFDTAEQGVDAAFEIHRRMRLYHELERPDQVAPECCIGIGYGDVLAIGPNLAMGDEMNRTSRLGEDVARGAETLITTGAYEALRQRDDLRFEPQRHEDVPFAFYRVDQAS